MPRSHCICPVCWHDETMRARRCNEEGCYDAPTMMDWCKSGGPLSTLSPHPARLEDGYWYCWRCSVVLNAREAGIFLDAALRCSHPDCDSIGEDGTHADTKIAFMGGADGSH